MFGSIPDKLSRGRCCLSVIGLGSAGLPLAVAMAHRYRVIGYDVNKTRVDALAAADDESREVGRNELIDSKIAFTDNEQKLKEALFHVVCAPSPVDRHGRPDLFPLVRASEIVGRNLGRGSIVVFESTVYPGVTEEICMCVLERESGLKAGTDFKVGYSPARTNPGDPEHCFARITKVVSGQDEQTAQIIAAVYSKVVEGGIHKTRDIKTAEAAKVIENIQRDLNIALMNELAILFSKMKIDTKDVLEAAGTKWNFFPFQPGLVGGHCIAVDPYYLTFKASEYGYHPRVILAGRSINDGMGVHIADQTVKQLIKCAKTVHGSRVLILGLAYKENVRDVRNSRVPDIVRELSEYGIRVLVHDPLADPRVVRRECGFDLVDYRRCRNLDAIIVAVAHDEYRTVPVETILKVSNGRPILIDVKHCFDRARLEQAGIIYWRL